MENQNISQPNGFGRCGRRLFFFRTSSGDFEHQFCAGPPGSGQKPCHDPVTHECLDCLVDIAERLYEQAIGLNTKNKMGRRVLKCRDTKSPIISPNLVVAFNYEVGTVLSYVSYYNNLVRVEFDSGIRTELDECLVWELP